MIAAKNLTRNYGSFTAVDNVSFTIGDGEIVGLLGHNGAGKTTIMKMLTGFLEPSGGSATINGCDIETERSRAQGFVGYLPENCPLYPEMTVAAFLDYAAELKGHRQRREGGRDQGSHRRDRAWRKDHGADLEPVARLPPARGRRAGHSAQSQDRHSRRAHQRPRPVADQANARAHQAAGRRTRR